MNIQYSKKHFGLLLALIALLSLSACSSFTPKALDYETIATSTPKKSINYGVYTPPGWTKSERLPLVLLLHGVLDNDKSFEKHKLNEYFDEQITAGQMPRVVVFTPDGKRGFWENWHDGTNSYRDWVLKDVMPKVQTDYNTLDCPQHCHITGISMGGFGALRVAYFEKNTFSSVSSISAPIINEKDNDPKKIPWYVRLVFPLDRIFGPEGNYKAESIIRVWTNTDDKKLEEIRLQLIWGDDERKSIGNSNHRFHTALEAKNRQHDMHIYAGGHKWIYWKPQFSRVINFLVDDSKKLAKTASNE